MLLSASLLLNALTTTLPQGLPAPPRELSGTWLMVRTQTGDVDLTPDDSGTQLRLRFVAGQVVSQVRGVKTQFPVSFDLTTTPKLIDFALGDPGKPVVMEGIWKVEGDTLTLCYNRPDKRERPTEFRPTAENGYFFMVLRRENP
jgi:uncharacterized protein (TIGR03067 family)